MWFFSFLKSLLQFPHLNSKDARTGPCLRNPETDTYVDVSAIRTENADFIF